MATITAEQFEEICTSVWRDRADLLKGCGILSGELTLVRAVYWRLSKTVATPPSSRENYDSQQAVPAYRTGVANLIAYSGNPPFDGAPFLNRLIDQYRQEVQNQSLEATEQAS